MHNTFDFAVITIQEHRDDKVERPAIRHHIQLGLNIHDFFNNVFDIVQLNVLPVLLQDFDYCLQKMSAIDIHRSLSERNHQRSLIQRCLSLIGQLLID